MNIEGWVCESSKSQIVDILYKVKQPVTLSPYVIPFS